MATRRSYALAAADAVVRRAEVFGHFGVADTIGLMASPQESTGIRAVITGPTTGYSGRAVTLDGSGSRAGDGPIRYHWAPDAAFMVDNPDFAQQAHNSSITLVLPEVPLRTVRRVGLTVYGADDAASPQTMHSIAIKPTPA